MIDRLKLKANLEKLIICSPSTSIENTKKLLEDEKARFILIADDAVPLSLLSDELLKGLDGDIKLSSLIENTPSILMTDKSIDDLEVEDLKQYFKHIRVTEAKGIILNKKSNPPGILSLEAIAECIPNDEVLGLSKRLYGGCDSPCRGFKCEMCSPPTYYFPNEGPTPVCPRNPSHGKMKRFE